MEFQELVRTAAALAKPRTVNKFVVVAEVGAALETDRGSVYTGVNMDVACGIGFCAEHAAVSEMVKNGENTVRRIVAVNSKGEILPPCGRCRELLNQIGDNVDCEVLVAEGTVKKLSELLPHDWRLGNF